MNEQADDFTRYWGRAADHGIGMGSVPAENYTSADIFAAERDKLLRKTWTPVARTGELPEPGDFIKIDVAALGAQAIVVRGKDGVVRAFHNACVHRGVTLVRECSGRTGLFVCPYHAWTYGTDGKLRGLPGAEDFPQIDRKTLGLKPIHLDIWNGFIFLNFDEGEPEQSLTDFLGDFATRFGDMPFDGYPHAIELVFDIAANWKLLVDATGEGYHVTVLHKQSLGPQTTSRENPLNHFYDPIFSAPHMSSTVQANAEWRPDQPVMRFVAAASAYKVQPGGSDAAEESRATFAGHEAMNRIGLPSFAAENSRIFPFTVWQMLMDRYLWFQVWPVAEDRTRFVVRVYAPFAPTSYREAFAEAHMVAYTRDITSEDAVITQLQQAGLRSGGVERVFYGENEYVPRFFHQMLQKHLDR